MKMTIKLISLLLPVYNEEQSVLQFILELDKFYQNKLQSKFKLELIFVDDGSKDNTSSLIESLIKLNEKDYQIKLIQLSKNFGKENALLAGFDHASGDALIPFDIDMQDPLILIETMLEEWEKGFKVVNAKRTNRSSEDMFKRITAHMYYKMMNYLTDNCIAEQVGDFRLLDKSVYTAIKSLREKNRFTKGLMTWVGFNTTTVMYERTQRVTGTTKFNFRKLLKLGFDGLFSFSDKPIRLSAYIGTGFMLLAFGFGIDIVIRTLLYGNDVAGYPSLMTVILFSFGLLFLMQGLQGEYIARIYNEVKNRPNYIVNKIISKDDNYEKE